MKRFWVSWYGENGVFELHSPWWFSGYTEGPRNKTIFCAAVIASTEEEAKWIVHNAHDAGHAPDWRFVEPRPNDWSPFNDRFLRADWMRWPA